MIRHIGIWAALIVITGWAAQAQAPEVPVVRAAVYDFSDAPGCAGRLIGRRVAEALNTALIQRGQWEMADRPSLLRECAAQGVEPPFGVGYLQMFGRRLEAPLAIAGLVQNCVLNERRGAAQVTLVCELTETVDGNGLRSFKGVGSAAMAQGETEPLDVIVDRALVEAAGDLAVALSGFDAWTTTVMATLEDGQVLLNAPAGRRVQVGEKLAIYRREADAWALVGFVEIARGDEMVLHTRMVSTSIPPQINDLCIAVAR